MKSSVLLGGLFLGWSVALVQAGSVDTISDTPGAMGKLTLNPSAVHVEGSSSDINLPDILEADFSDAPFHLDYFTSIGDTSAVLPPGWMTQDIGHVDAPGAVAYASGTFTLTGDELDNRDGKDQTDHCMTVGMPWTGNGQWTFRIKSVDSPKEGVVAGFMLRESLDPFAADMGIGAYSDQPTAVRFSRNEQHGTWGNNSNLDSLPEWFRVTRRGVSMEFEMSPDGQQWSPLGQNTVKMTDTIWAGFFINAHKGKSAAKIVVDQIRFTPAPGPAPGLIVPTGVLLRSGTFIAGTFNSLDFNGADPTGNFYRNEKSPPSHITASQTMAAVYHPVLRKKLSDVGTKVGTLMPDDDFLAGTFEAINGGGVRLDSILLGTLSYDRDQIAACVLNTLQPRAAEYEVRLKDGSSVIAGGLSVSNSQLVADDISGVEVTFGPDEVAQFRAGPAHLLSLLDLPWKATPPPPAPAPVPAATPAAAAPTNAPAAAPAAPGATAPPPAPAVNPAPLPPAECWVGNNQEQILVAASGTVIDFPLTVKSRAVALRIALSPDTPPNTLAAVRILADGVEVGRTPPFRAGDAPRFVEVTVQNPRMVTIVADSVYAGTKILLIDPVAVREDVAPAP